MGDSRTDVDPGEAPHLAIFRPRPERQNTFREAYWTLEITPVRRGRLFLIALLAVACTACRPSKSKDSDQSDASPAELTLVSVTNPERQDLERGLEITAKVVAKVQGDVASRLSGLRVLEIHKDLGDFAAKDELLAKLDPEDVVKRVAEAELQQKEVQVRHAEAALAVRELEAELSGQTRTVERKKEALARAEQQAARGALAVEDVDQARYDLDREVALVLRLNLQIEKAKVNTEAALVAVDRAGLSLANARQDLGHTEVRAPYQLIVTERLVQPGSLLSANQPLFRGYDPESLVIETYLAQRDLASVGEKLPVELWSDALPGLRIRATVKSVAPTVEKDSGTIGVRLELDAARGAETHESKANRPLRPGLYLAGRIVLETKPKALTVPRKAVGYHRGTPFVMKVTPDTNRADEAIVTRVLFQEGLGERGSVEVVTEAKDLLRAEDLIVLVGQDRLKDGDRVRFQRVAEAAASSGTAEKK